MTVTRPAPEAVAPAPAAGFGPPPAPRPARSMAGAVLGLLLIVFCAVAVAVFTANAGHRRAVLVVARPVQAGAELHSSDLAEVRLSADPSLRTMAASERDRVVGRIASVNLVVGTLLTSGQLATGPLVDVNHAVVGLALKSGQSPGGLRTLDRVLLVDTGPAAAITGSPSAGAAAVIAADAVVTGSAVAVDGQSTVVSVLVPLAEAPRLAAAGARGQVSVILLGGPAGPGSQPQSRPAAGG